MKIVDVVIRELPYSGRTVSGFGAALPTTKCIRLDIDTRWRRVYCTCFSNIGTAWVRVRGAKYVVDGFGVDPALWTIENTPWSTR